MLYYNIERKCANITIKHLRKDLVDVLFFYQKIGKSLSDIIFCPPQRKREDLAYNLITKN